MKMWIVDVLLRKEDVVYVTADTKEEALKRARMLDDVVEAVDARPEKEPE